MVRNKVLSRAQKKLRIDAVLQQKWKGFDFDIHCDGSFIIASDVKKKKKKKQQVKRKEEI